MFFPLSLLYFLFYCILMFYVNRLLIVLLAILIDYLRCLLFWFYILLCNWRMTHFLFWLWLLLFYELFVFIANSCNLIILNFHVFIDNCLLDTLIAWTSIPFYLFLYFYIIILNLFSHTFNFCCLQLIANIYII